VIAAHYGVELAPEELAAVCQWVENQVAGAPCGIMDQMTAACGQRDRLLRLRCQPGTVEGHLGIPAGYRFYGIDSGIRHAVTGADYATVRAAAFMGYRIIADAAGLPATLEGGRARVEDERWGGYLANFSELELGRYEGLLPERLSGADFLARYGGITDGVTSVQPGTVYPVRRATVHPVHEQARVERFAALLAQLPGRPEAAAEMGRLMFESHDSYGACGLGSEGTDRLVNLVDEAGPGRGLFGAKITGGGSGGTVAVFAAESAEPRVRAIAARYAAETGLDAALFTGSGPGAAETGVLELTAAASS
jgi:L-arabinokinase